MLCRRVSPYHTAQEAEGLWGKYCSHKPEKCFLSFSEEQETHILSLIITQQASWNIGVRPRLSEKVTLVGWVTNWAHRSELPWDVELLLTSVLGYICLDAYMVIHSKAVKNAEILVLVAWCQVQDLWTCTAVRIKGHVWNKGRSLSVNTALLQDVIDDTVVCVC